MAKKLSAVSLMTRPRPRSVDARPVEKKVVLPPSASTDGPKLRVWLATLFMVGVIILVVMSVVAPGWFNGVVGLIYPTNVVPSITPVKVGPTDPYAGLQFTV